MELIDDAGNPPNLYVHLDTYHMNIEESSSEHAVGVCGDKLGYASVQTLQKWPAMSASLQGVTCRLWFVEYGAFRV